jgi:hypothetical protein
LFLLSSSLILVKTKTVVVAGIILLFGCILDGSHSSRTHIFGKCHFSDNVSDNNTTSTNNIHSILPVPVINESFSDSISLLGIRVELVASVDKSNFEETRDNDGGNGDSSVGGPV